MKKFIAERVHRHCLCIVDLSFSLGVIFYLFHIIRWYKIWTVGKNISCHYLVVCWYWVIHMTEVVKLSLSDLSDDGIEYTGIRLETLINYCFIIFKSIIKDTLQKRSFPSSSHPTLLKGKNQNSECHDFDTGSNQGKEEFCLFCDLIVRSTPSMKFCWLYH